LGKALLNDSNKQAPIKLNQWAKSIGFLKYSKAALFENII
jgi:hypothetical protein